MSIKQNKMGQKVYKNTTEFVLACWAQDLP